MNEGYLIPLVTAENAEQVELLAHTIKRLDPSRHVAAITKEKIDKISSVDDVIVLDGLCDDETFNYFFSLLHSPFDKTIALLPDQLLTYFNTDVWENLRGLGSMVILDKKYSFNGETLDDSIYWNGITEIKSFGFASNVNAVYFDKEKDAKDLLGFAINLSSNYNHDDVLNWVNEKNNEGDELFLPYLPDFLWPSWIISFMRMVIEDKIIAFDFMQNIDLGKQEMNHNSRQWREEPWNRFLNYWLTDSGELKVENFIQLGLIKYQHCGWLTDKIKNKIKE
jgi:hypothetical protein